ncbi:MAG: hypothetical protein JST61_16215 [Acidobacteria bacterium]|nr:hypothetical protein [Acidobacteriota bacterium]
MKTVLELIRKAGGWHPGLYLKITNEPYMELVIEAMDESGPCGLPAVSVAHYTEQNGDLMRDPEMCFELGFAGGAHLNPFYWRNDRVGIEQWSRFIHDGNYCFHPQLHEQHERFAKLWDKNLAEQRFVEAFTDKRILG